MILTIHFALQPAAFDAGDIIGLLAIKTVILTPVFWQFLFVLSFWLLNLLLYMWINDTRIMNEY